ncbi:MAG: hypothetical protein D6717_07670 [Gammaproteobacteria bacterium]|nr:MAG: hypothetical protein D6717_07670 [Gammaproteobacteria bacterium]
MAIRELERDHWKDYFDHFSSVSGTELVEVEVAGLDIGDQVEAEWLPLAGISYDPKDDVLTIDAGEVLQHMVRSPRVIRVDEDDSGIHSFEVEDGDGHVQVLRLKAPLALPPAE